MLEALSSQVVHVHLSVCESENPFFSFVSLMNGGISMKMITINQQQVHVTLILRRSQVQRSGSARSGHRNLVNTVAPELLKRFEPKLIQIISCSQMVRFSMSWVHRSKS